MTRRGWDWSAARALCLRQARRILGAGADAEDAAQEALIRAWRMRDNCLTPEAPEAWLISIARREALRVAARRAERPLEEAAAVATPSHEVSALLRVDVGRAVAALPGDDRRLIGERYWGDQTQAQVARLHDMAEGTVKVRLNRIRARLRETLNEP